MKISDRNEFDSKPAPLTARPTDSVLDAVKAMDAKNYGSVIVVDDAHQVIGMMTERDIFRRLVAEKRDPEQTTVGEIMTSEVRTARADDELVDWLRIMSNERFRRLPVVDGQGKLIAVMSQGDFVSYTWPELLTQAKDLAKATFGESLSFPMVLLSILAYTLLVVLGVALAT